MMGYDPIRKFTVLFGGGHGIDMGGKRDTWELTGSHWQRPSVSVLPEPGWSGVNIPTGEAEFNFRSANLNFKSKSDDWLIVKGSRIQYRGFGTINGAGDYSFIISASSSEEKGRNNSDKFRIKIWDESSGHVIYDTMRDSENYVDPVTEIKGGLIVIHK